MGKFIVKLKKTTTYITTVEIESANVKSAKQESIEKASSFEYQEIDNVYKVESCIPKSYSFDNMDYKDRVKILVKFLMDMRDQEAEQDVDFEKNMTNYILSNYPNDLTLVGTPYLRMSVIQQDFPNGDKFANWFESFSL